MKLLPTVSKAKEEIEFLQKYVFLAETYEAQSVQEQIIKLYAYTGSIKQVTEQLNEERKAERLMPIDAAYVSETIQSRVKDPLHRLIRRNYMNKTKHNRNR